MCATNNMGNILCSVNATLILLHNTKKKNVGTEILVSIYTGMKPAALLTDRTNVKCEKGVAWAVHIRGLFNPDHPPPGDVTSANHESGGNR